MTFDWNGILPQEPGRALGVVGACIVALAGAAWGVFSFGYSQGLYVGQSKLSDYQHINSVKLPEVTSALLAVNKDLRESLKVFDRNKTLEAEAASYQDKLEEAVKSKADLDIMLKKMQGDLRDADERETHLRDEILKIAGESRRLMLAENQSEILGEGHSVGLAGDKTPTSLDVTVDNKNYEMRAGNSVAVDLISKACALTLTSLHWFEPTSGEFD